MSVSCKSSVRRDNRGIDFTRSGHEANADFFSVRKSAYTLKRLGHSAARSASASSKSGARRGKASRKIIVMIACEVTHQ
jgi:hypothetical protein